MVLRCSWRGRCLGYAGGTSDVLLGTSYGCLLGCGRLQPSVQRVSTCFRKSWILVVHWFNKLRRLLKRYMSTARHGGNVRLTVLSIWYQHFLLGALRLKNGLLRMLGRRTRFHILSAGAILSTASAGFAPARLLAGIWLPQTKFILYGLRSSDHCITGGSRCGPCRCLWIKWVKWIKWLKWIQWIKWIKWSE